MTPDELRERIERSGVSGCQMARALGVERAQPSKSRRGVKPMGSDDDTISVPWDEKARAKSTLITC